MVLLAQFEQLLEFLLISLYLVFDNLDSLACLPVHLLKRTEMVCKVASLLRVGQLVLDAEDQTLSCERVFSQWLLTKSKIVPGQELALVLKERIGLVRCHL